MNNCKHKDNARWVADSGPACADVVAIRREASTGLSEEQLCNLLTDAVRELVYVVRPPRAAGTDAIYGLARRRGYGER